MTGGKFNNPLIEVPMNSGHTLTKGVESWMKGEKIVWIDEVNWPGNSPCARKLSLQVNWREG